MMLVADFDFELPPDLIAQEASVRGSSRLLVVHRTTGRLVDAHISDLPGVLETGDRLVVNDTRVFPARLVGRRDPSGGAAECLLLERVDRDTWDALVHPGQKIKPGTRLLFERDVVAPGVCLRAEVLEQRFFGRRRVRLSAEGADVDAAIDRIGHIPLPPYIRRSDRPDDRERYQTCYARVRGSIAAPTAGLHFDEAVIAALVERGIGWTPVTLHVGYGTFKPVRADRVEEHAVDAERYSISQAAADAIAETRRAGRRVIAVGTTTTRALESAGAPDALAVEMASTDLFIRPGHSFHVVDGLVTNFHLPRSSLFMLVCAFGGRDLMLHAYRHAVAERYRFYSYGDAMLIL
jgi:S-adenosylmethionine:tRNA ribosyltransferase-isomerase